MGVGHPVSREAVDNSIGNIAGSFLGNFDSLAKLKAQLAMLTDVQLKTDPFNYNDDEVFLLRSTVQAFDGMNVPWTTISNGNSPQSFALKVAGV